MYSTRVNQDFCFEKNEMEQIAKTTQEILAVLKQNNLTYAQAVEALEQSKIELQMCLLG